MRFLPLVLSLAVSPLFFGCDSAVRCGPLNCNGCCDASGVCQPGSAKAACGKAGLTCSACLTSQACAVGSCAASGTGGGTASGGGSGGSSGGGGGAMGSGGGGSLGGGAGGGAPTYETWCDDSYLTALCDASVRCGAYSTTAACRSTMTAYGVCASTAALRDGRVEFDRTTAASCVSQFSGSCDEASLLACASVLRGAGAAGQACYASNECKTGLFCTSNSCPGSCQPRTPIGQTNPSGAECAEGSFLSGTVCAALVPIGQSCARVSPETTDKTCVPGAYCASGRMCAARPRAAERCPSFNDCAGLLSCQRGVCKALGELNASCNYENICKLGTGCSAVGLDVGVCIAPVGNGAACITAPFRCEAHLVCDAPPGTQDGFCDTVHTLGEPCSALGFQCGFGNSLYCTAHQISEAGVCALKKSVGATCVIGTDCQSNKCTSGVCSGCVDPTP